MTVKLNDILYRYMQFRKLSLCGSRSRRLLAWRSQIWSIKSTIRRDLEDVFSSYNIFEQVSNSATSRGQDIRASSFPSTSPKGVYLNLLAASMGLTLQSPLLTCTSSHPAQNQQIQIHEPLTKAANLRKMQHEKQRGCWKISLLIWWGVRTEGKIGGVRTPLTWGDYGAWEGGLDDQLRIFMWNVRDISR